MNKTKEIWRGSNSTSFPLTIFFLKTLLNLHQKKLPIYVCQLDRRLTVRIQC